jgi:hypothetical protein
VFVVGVIKADTEVNIYNIASHKGLKGEIDTRLLTKNGRIQIAKDIKKSGMITSAIQQIVLDLELDLDLKLDLDLELFWSMSAIWILPLPRVARTLVLELCLLLV